MYGLSAPSVSGIDAHHDCIRQHTAYRDCEKKHQNRIKLNR